MPTYYVRTSATAGGDGTNNTDSSGDGSHAFQTLAACEAILDDTTNLVTNTLTHTVICSVGSGSAADTSAEIKFLGYTTNATYNITLQGETATQVAYDTTRYRIEYSAASGYRETLDVSGASYTTIEDFQIQLTVSNGARDFCIGYYTGSATNCEMRRCIAKGVITNDPRACAGFSMGTNIARACLAYDFTGTTTSEDNRGFALTTGLTQNCTAHNCVYGWSSNYAAGEAENCIASDPAGGGDANLGRIGDCDYCQEDSAGTAWLYSNTESAPSNYRGSVTFVDEGNDDFTPASGDTIANENGKYLSGTFNYDLLNNTWPATWSIGAVVPAVSGTTVTPSAGQINFTGQTPTVGKALSTVPSPGVVRFTGQTPSAGKTLATSPSPGTVNFSGQTPSVGKAVSVNPASGIFTFGGQTPTTATFKSTSPTAGILHFDGIAPTVGRIVAVNPTAGTIQFRAGPVPIVEIGGETNVAPSPGTVQFLGNAPTVSRALTVAPTAGVFRFTGAIPSVSSIVARSATPAAGILQFLGIAPTVTISTPVVSVVTRDDGAGAGRWDEITLQLQSEDELLLQMIAKFVERLN